MLIYRKPIAGGMSYTKLILVPTSVQNILFIAFHSNALGGHFDAYRTLHHLCLCYYWPEMYTFIKQMCLACPGCTLSNPTKSKSSKFVYNFPIEAPVMVLHVDAYMAGFHPGFEGSEMYLLACCGMCTFGTLEPLSGANATTFASAIMKIQLRYGFCHTSIFGQGQKILRCLLRGFRSTQSQLPCPLRGQSQPHACWCFCRYFNKGLTIMCNKCDTVQVALECLLLLLYAWNSCPVPGTDISRSLVAVGCKFAFPIDYSSGKHWQLTSSPATVESYSKELATHRSTCCKVANLLVMEQCKWHRALINSCHPDPCVYLPSDGPEGRHNFLPQQQCASRS